MNVLDSILNLFFPPRCSSCKKEGDFLCYTCRGKLKIKNIRPISIHPSDKDFTYLDGVIYGVDYNENPEIQAAIKQFKYKFTQDLADYFGKILVGKLKELKMLTARRVIFVPVPLHRQRRWQRGFNQAKLIAENTAYQMGDHVQIHSLLGRLKNTSQQARLNKTARLENLSDAFEVRGDLKLLEDRVCFLVDDVCTTGATLDNCAKLLKEKGVKRVYGLVVARAFK